MWAIEGGHLETVKMLLERGADVNQENEWGQTPLMLAAKEGQSSILNALLDKGANINQQSKFGGMTALMWAAIEEKITCVKTLIDRGRMLI